MQTETEKIPMAEAPVARPKLEQPHTASPSAAIPCALAQPTASETDPLTHLVNPQPSAGYEVATIDHQKSPTVIDSPPAAAAGYGSKPQGQAQGPHRLPPKTPPRHR